MNIAQLAIVNLAVVTLIAWSIAPPPSKLKIKVMGLGSIGLLVVNAVALGYGAATL